MNRKGFTLVELIVVIAIIAVLAAIIAPNAFKAVEKAKISGTIEDYRSIKTGAMAYYADTGTWVNQCTNTPCTGGFVSNNSVAGWDGPYLEKWPPLAKWSGNYLWCVTAANATAPCVTFDTDSSQDRHVLITNVPAAAAAKIDQSLDGSIDLSNGSVRYTNATTTNVSILVSED